MMGQQDLPPGFRFSPTDEELVVYYLKNRAFGKDFHQGVIAEVDIYKHEPWDLPEISALPSPDPVWYFFNAQEKRHSHTARINRTTGKGYWKATGKDRKISCGPQVVGIKKTLIYYEGRAPSGKRTDWIMHEYKLDEEFERKSKTACSTTTTLCRIRKKGGPGPRNGEQFGASVYAEYNDGECVEEDVDEKPPLALRDSKQEPSAFSSPNLMEEAEVQKEVVLHEPPIEGCASNDLSHAEGLDTNTEEDLQAFLEQFLASDDREATSFKPEMVSELVADSTFADNHVHATSPDFFTDFSEMQSDLIFDDKTLHDLLQSTSGEEQILGEMLHLADGGKMHSHVPSAHNDTTVNGDFIELDDMNHSFDGFVMRSPLEGSYYIPEEKVESSLTLLSGVEDFGGSSELLHTQGSAPRRVRLQAVPPCGRRMNGDTNISPPTNVHPEVHHGVRSRDLNIQIIGGLTSQSTTSTSSGSSRGSEEVCDIEESSRLSVLFNKQPYMITKCQEVPPQVFLAATAGSQEDEEACSNESKRGMLLPSAALPSSYSNSVIVELANKVRSLELGRGFARLEGNLSTTFNDKVFALGKPVAQIVPTCDYANPYGSLRRGAMSSLLRLVAAVVFLFFLFLGIRIIAY